MKERNKYLEADGLFFESETHEWFKDKSSTSYAQNPDLNDIKLENIYAFVVRDKATGEYERVLMDKESNEVIYANQRLEQIGVHIDKLKLLKQSGQLES